MKKIIFSFPVACALLMGCAPDHVNLVSHYQPSFNTLERRLPAETGQACKVVTSIEDGRTPEDVVSGFGWKQVESKDVLAWLQSGVSSLQSPQYQLIRADAANAGSVKQTLRMSIKLRKMYIMSLTTSKSATIVLSIDTANAQGQSIGQASVRGTDTSVNWVSGEGETNSAFHDSLEQALSKFDQYVADQCKSVVASNAP